MVFTVCLYVCRFPYQAVIPSIDSVVEITIIIHDWEYVKRNIWTKVYTLCGFQSFVNISCVMRLIPQLKDVAVRVNFTSLILCYAWK